jgi:hypothetical protein
MVDIEQNGMSLQVHQSTAMDVHSTAHPNRATPKAERSTIQESNIIGVHIDGRTCIN